VKAFTDEANKFNDNANKNLFGFRTTYVDIITEFFLLPSTGRPLYSHRSNYYFFHDSGDTLDQSRDLFNNRLEYESPGNSGMDCWRSTYACYVRNER
jgi:hypothetical protein